MIKNKIIEKIKASKRCRNRLAYELNCSHRSVEKWLERNDIMLTTDLALKVISEEINVKKSEILIEEKATA